MSPKPVGTSPKPVDTSPLSVRISLPARLKIECGNRIVGRFNFAMKRLAIFDINGFLCQKVPKDYEGPVDLELQSYKVILRPGCGEFLSQCYERFTIGFFSSTTYKNAGPILQELLTQEQDKATLFKWFRDRTSLDLDWMREISSDPSWQLDLFVGMKLEKHSTVKRLSSVLETPFLNDDRIYSLKNTLICDDSAEKLRFNPKANCLVVEPFTGERDDTVLSTLVDEIDRRFSQL